MNNFLFFAAGGSFGLTVGIVLGCLVYSGRGVHHKEWCECSVCRRERWMAGEFAPLCRGHLHDFVEAVAIGDACDCGQMEIKYADGARYVGPRGGC